MTEPQGPSGQPNRFALLHGDGALVRTTSILVGLMLSLVPVVIVWDNGGLIAWTKYWISIALGALALAATPLLASRELIVYRRVLWIPTLLESRGSAVGCKPSICLPKVVKWVAPGSAQAYQNDVPELVRRELASKSPEFADGSVHPASLSQWKTTGAMYLPGLFGLTTFLGILLFSQRRAMTQLLVIIAIAGCLFSFLALSDSVRAARKDDTLLITPQNIPSSAPFGSFVNKNSAGLFINWGWLARSDCW